jgi:hypothetical protein
MVINDFPDIIEAWPTIKYKVTLICNYYSSLYEMDLRAKIEQLKVNGRDPVLRHEEQMRILQQQTTLDPKSTLEMTPQTTACINFFQAIKKS